MASYKCPDCPNFLTQQWGLLKGHLVRKHARNDISDFKDASAFKDYEISDEEFNNLRSASSGMKVAIGEETDNPQTPPPDGQRSSAGILPPVEPLTEYVGEPVTRLRQILLVNGGVPSIVETISKIMALNKWLWNNPDQIEAQLLAHFGQTKKAWIQACVTQYWRGVELPDELKGGSHPYYNQGAGYGAPGYGYQGGYQNMQPNFGQTGANPEIAELRATVNRLLEEKKEEAQRQRDQALLDRIAKLESGGTKDPIASRLDAIEKQLTGGGQQQTMTIIDGQGHPMVLPYDRSFLEAMQRKSEAESQEKQFQQIVTLMGNRGGVDEATKAQMKRLEDATAEANKRVEDLIKSMTDQRLASLEAAVQDARNRAKAAEDLAAAGTGESKGVLDFAGEAASDIRDGASEIARQVKEGVSDSIDKLAQVITNRPATTTTVTAKSPSEIADIMEAENKFLKTLGEK